MISFIRGEVCDIGPDFLVVDNNGIGYKIFATSSVLNTARIGFEIKAFTYFQVTENGFYLYGFSSKEELALFELVISVNGIGPKGGLAIMSTISASDLRFAIAGGDSKLIATAPGIGKKTAERLILDLRDKIDFNDAFESKLNNSGDSSQAAAISSIKNEAILALNSLGYSSSEVLRAMNDIDITEDMDTETLLKATLKKMAFI